MKINTVDGSHGGQDPESFQEKGSAGDVDGRGVCRVEERPEQLGVKQACGGRSEEVRVSVSVVCCVDAH
jgi:hypothetical protein